MMKFRPHGFAHLATACFGIMVAILAFSSPAFAAGYYPVGDWPSVSRLSQPADVSVANLTGEVFVADTGGRRIADRKSVV